MNQAESLSHLLWIGGPPRAGKSSVATRLARRHGLRLYSADTRTWEHRDRALRAGNAAALRWEAMSPEERWDGPSPEEMLEMSLHCERGAMVIDDLRALPRSPLVVAEGSPLPASALPGLVERSQAVWLIPSREFQERALRERSTAPGRAALYRTLGETIAREAKEHGAPLLAIDGSLDLEQTVDAVEELFAEVLAAGPCAEALAERRALLREANDAIAAQVRGFYARPWANGNPGSVKREFICECGHRNCDASVLIPLSALESGPVLAPGHSRRVSDPAA